MEKEFTPEYEEAADKLLAQVELKPMTDREIMFVRQACVAFGLTITFKEAEQYWLEITRDMGLARFPVGTVNISALHTLVRSKHLASK